MKKLFNLTLFNTSLIKHTATKASFKDCFLEATGIAAGVGIVGALAGNTVSRGQILRLLVKFGGKTAIKFGSVVGLTLNILIL